MSDDDALEHQLRALMQDDSGEPGSRQDDQRLDRVLHKAHIHGGIFDLLNLFGRWGWVLSEGGARALRHARPVRRDRDSSSSEQ